MKKIAQGYFKSHPSVNEFFFTSDEQAFFTKQAAENHAGSLPKDAREVTVITRAEAEGNEDKVAQQKEKAIEKATTKVTAAKEKLAVATEKADKETDEVKKQKLVVAVTTAQAAVDEAEAELKKVSE